ncbi:hypothetical protein ANT_00040 [Anaerolinea thermophila UNI-1]|uniref:Uncharacterized protein n=1 Tax=Anaerolinea thermophila (strain DSM 14523 / JCM 11388 / NBRC 100420 / UNI-1) TaxID=926569 RepID=E8MY93_ANATU|nr:hypothetical protein ANT_00040 [Anaerolinea thermophila UNI-1]
MSLRAPERGEAIPVNKGIASFPTVEIFRNDTFYFLEPLFNQVIIKV